MIGRSDRSVQVHDRIQRELGPFRSELEAAAIEADDPAVADVHAALAALARGERVPRDVANRIVARAEDSQ